MLLIRMVQSFVLTRDGAGTLQKAGSK